MLLLFEFKIIGESVAIKSGAGREFDPLQQQQQQIQNSFNEIPNQGGVGPQGEKPPPEGDNQTALINRPDTEFLGVIRALSIGGFL